MSIINTVAMRAADGNVVKLEVHTSLPSTVELAREYAAKGYPDRFAIFTDKRIKTSSDKKSDLTVTENGIFLTLILRPSIFPSQASLLGALSATAMITALDRHTDSHLGLGWVSDLYCNGVKIGGASFEGKLDSYTTYEYILVSFAVRTDKDSFPPRLTDMIEKVFNEENSSVSMILARSILDSFFKLYPKIKTSGRFMDTYAERFILRGAKIKHVKDGQKLTYRVLGIDKKNGSLIVETGSGELKPISSPGSVIMPKKVKYRI